MGLFITFEGPEGSGKTTQLRLLAPYLRRLGSDVLVTREPGGTPIGDRVRGILLDPEHTEMLPNTEFLLFSAARAQHVGQVIRPHLQRGGIVLCDRFADSSLAYQGYGRGLDLDRVREAIDFATGGLAPDLYVVLDIPVEEGEERQRRDGGGADRIEAAGGDFRRTVRDAYLALAESEPRVEVVSGRGTPEDVHARIRGRLVERFPDVFASSGATHPGRTE